MIRPKSKTTYHGCREVERELRMHLSHVLTPTFPDNLPVMAQI